MHLMPWGLIAIALLSSWLMTAAVRRYALASSLLDIPNARSSHSAPMPRGGGIAIVASFLLMVAGLGLAARIDGTLCVVLLGSGLLVAVLGFIDDKRGLPARWRFGGHVLAALWLIYWAGSLPLMPVMGQILDLGPLTAVLAALYVVWSINFFNFMDGIDGIASVEAISVTLGGALVWWLVQPLGDWPVAVLFAACVSGFLFWNFPPARIFMGDAGSGFLGVVVAVLALWSARDSAHLVWCWVILTSVFLVDATTTLLRRVRRGEHFAEAHRNHAYQYAARTHGSHRAVTLAVLAINIVWLLPLAVAVALRWLDGIVGVAVATAPLVWLAFHYKAGDRAGQAV